MQALRSLFARCINRMRIVVSSFLLLMDVMFKSFWSLKSSLLASANDISNVSVAGSDNRDLSSLEHSDNIPSDVNLIPLLYCQNVLVLTLIDTRVIPLLHLFQNPCVMVVE